MIIDDPAAKAELQAEFDAYETALMANDLAALDGFFWPHELALRFGVFGLQALQFRRSTQRIGAQAADVAEPEAKKVVVAFNGAIPFGDVDIDGQNAQAMALGILDENRGVVKAHRLIVQERACEGREIVALEPGAGIGKKRKARSV